MFKKFFDELLAATTAEQINAILYREDGVDRAFQREKITWQDHERLFKMAAKMQEALPKYRIVSDDPNWYGWMVKDRDGAVVYMATDRSYDDCERWIKAHA